MCQYARSYPPRCLHLMHYSQLLNWQGEGRWCDERRHRATCPAVCLAEVIRGEEGRQNRGSKRKEATPARQSQNSMKGWAEVRCFHANSILHSFNRRRVFGLGLVTLTDRQSAQRANKLWWRAGQWQLLSQDHARISKHPYMRICFST